MRYLIKISSRYLFNGIILRLDLFILSHNIELFEIEYLAGYPISFRLVILRLYNFILITISFFIFIFLYYANSLMIRYRVFSIFRDYIS